MLSKESVALIEENMMILAGLADKLKADASLGLPYTRAQLQFLIRLHIGGRARLKDIAMREGVPASNLCTAFRSLESDGLVLRTVDSDDRRNTWYSATKSGSRAAAHAIEVLREKIASLFDGLSARDEKKLNGAIKTMNEILKNIKAKYEN